MWEKRGLNRPGKVALHLTGQAKDVLRLTKVRSPRLSSGQAGQAPNAEKRKTTKPETRIKDKCLKDYKHLNDSE